LKEVYRYCLVQEIRKDKKKKLTDIGPDSWLS